MKVLEFLTTICAIVIMMILTIAVGLTPLFIFQYYHLTEPSMEALARYTGCILAIPMIRLNFKVIEWVMDLKYWRQ